RRGRGVPRRRDVLRAGTPLRRRDLPALPDPAARRAQGAPPGRALRRLCGVRRALPGRPARRGPDRDGRGPDAAVEILAGEPVRRDHVVGDLQRRGLCVRRGVHDDAAPCAPLRGDRVRDSRRHRGDRAVAAAPARQASQLALRHGAMDLFRLPPSSSILPGLVLLALALADASAFHVFAFADRALGDGLARAAAAQARADRDIIVVDIDDRSLEQMASDAFGVGRFPWPRAVYGELVDELRRQKARAVVFDIELYEQDLANPASDAVLNEALKAGDNTYFPIKMLPRIARDEGVFLARVAPALGLAKRGSVDADARATLQLPFAIDRSAWPRTGLIDFLPDVDGVGRRYWIARTIGGFVIPSLPARVALDLGYAVPDAESARLAWMSGGEFPHPRVAFVDLYEDIQRGKRERPRDEFTGKIVVVGASATHLGDFRPTPLSTVTPGVAILATAIDNLKNGRWVREAPAWAEPLVVLLLFVPLLVAQRRRAHIGTLLALLAVLSLGVAGGAY